MIGGIVGDIVGGTHIFDSIAVELPLDSVSITDYQLSVSGGGSVALPVDAITIADYPVEVKFVIALDLPVDTVSVTDFAPDIDLILTIDLPVDTVTVTDYVPEVKMVLPINLPVDQISIEDFAITAEGGSSVSLPVDNVTITDHPVGIAIIIRGVPDFLLEKDGTTIDITVRNREGKDVAIYESTEYNTAMSLKEIITSDTKQYTGVTGRQAYKLRFVGRVSGTVVARGRPSIRKFTTN
jgi:hypothetical protein